MTSSFKKTPSSAPSLFSWNLPPSAHSTTLPIYQHTRVDCWCGDERPDHEKRKSPLDLGSLAHRDRLFLFMRDVYSSRPRNDATSAAVRLRMTASITVIGKTKRTVLPIHVTVSLSSLDELHAVHGLIIDYMSARLQEYATTYEVAPLQFVHLHAGKSRSSAQRNGSRRLQSIIYFFIFYIFFYRLFKTKQTCGEKLRDEEQIRLIRNGNYQSIDGSEGSRPLFHTHRQRKSRRQAFCDMHRRYPPSAGNKEKMYAPRRDDTSKKVETARPAEPSSDLDDRDDHNNQQQLHEDEPNLQKKENQQTAPGSFLYDCTTTTTTSSRSSRTEPSRICRIDIGSSSTFSTASTVSTRR